MKSSNLVLMLMSFLITSLWGCVPDFDDIKIVKDLRFLAINADPPEQILFRTPEEIPPELYGLLEGGDLPETIPGLNPVTINPLVVDPRSTADKSYKWEVHACSAEETHCDAAAYQEQLASGDSSLEEIQFDFLPNGRLLQAAFENDPYAGFGGLALMVEFRIYDDELQLWIKATKRIVYTFWLPYSPVPGEKESNRNPTIDDIDLVEFDSENNEVRRMKLSTLNGAFILGAEHELEIVPSITEDSKEAYVQVATDVDGIKDGNNFETNEVKLEECDKGEKRSTDPDVSCGCFFNYRFYTTAGELSHEKTGGVATAFFENKKVKDLSVRWTRPDPESEEYPGSDATIWIVVSDGRGGITWTSFLIDYSAAL